MPAHLVIGYAVIDNPINSRKNPEWRGEIAFRTGKNKLSNGLLKFNKKSNKAKIYWDKNLDGIHSKKDIVIGSLKIDKSLASNFWKFNSRGFGF